LIRCETSFCFSPVCERKLFWILMVLGDGSIALSRKGRRLSPGLMGNCPVQLHTSTCANRQAHEIMSHVGDTSAVVDVSLMHSGESTPNGGASAGESTPPPTGAAASPWGSKLPARALLLRASTLASMAQVDGKAFGRYSNKQLSFESLDYDDAENTQVRAACSISERERHRQHRHQVAIVWALVVLIGFLTGSVAFCTTRLIGVLATWKVEVVQAALTRGAPVEGWLLLSAFVLVLALCAALLTVWAPEAAGSGIPHVKAFLNGNKIEGALRPRTLVAKAVGVCCSVAAGMPAGREGPMVQAGAIIANALPMCVVWCRRALGVDPTTVDDLQNDFDRRNFVSMGAAAGVAAAFHAPIGGILFSLEEVSTFWVSAASLQPARIRSPWPGIECRKAPAW
jgi:hypothetical protein